MTTANDFDQEIASQAGLSGFLARLWGREVDLDLLDQLQQPPLRSSMLTLPGMENWFDSISGNSRNSTEDVLSDLAADYCRILIGPRGHAAPRQSVWRDGQLNGSAASEMNRILRAVQTPELPAVNAPDHFANQLQVFAVMVSCIESADPTYGIIAEDFLKNHLLWAKPMLRKAAAIAATDFYRGLALFTADWLADLESNSSQRLRCQ